jgi:hypothetical protein
MCCFKEWLYQRDKKVYSEMFDKKNTINYFYLSDKIDSGGPIEIHLNNQGKEAIARLTGFGSGNLRKDDLEEMGSSLINKLDFIIKDRDIDVTPLRNELKKLAPQAEMAFDAIIKRFATRVGRKVGNDGNMLFSLQSAQKGLRQDPSKIAMYQAGMGEREAEKAKQTRLQNIRSLEFGEPLRPLDAPISTT